MEIFLIKSCSSRRLPFLTTTPELYRCHVGVSRKRRAMRATLSTGATKYKGFGCAEIQPVGTAFLESETDGVNLAAFLDELEGFDDA